MKSCEKEVNNNVVSPFGMFPGQPIQMKGIFFFKPERAATRPPLDILKHHPPSAVFSAESGKRLEITINRLSAGVFDSDILLNIQQLHKENKGLLA
jgi:hypothetical protein